MIHGRLYRQDNQQLLFPDVMYASNPMERMRGLLARPRLTPEQGLIIKPCSSIHTIGMGYPIDLMFLNKDWRIEKLVHNLKPWRMAWSLGSSMVIETLGNTLKGLQLTIGAQLRWEEF